MAPGLNGRQTGTLPKNKSRSCGSQSHRLNCEPFVQMPFTEWESMSELGNKVEVKKKSSSSRCETEADLSRHELGRSKSSTTMSLIGNGEGCSHDSSSEKIAFPDRKQVANKLCQIQNYVQQTAALMSSLKTSDSANKESQYKKLAAMLEDLKDSECKLSSLLTKMDSTESKIDTLLTDATDIQSNNNDEPEEEELARMSKESKKKLEVLQRRKQDLLKLQDKAKKQLQEAQAEQTRLVARASSLNQDLNANKIPDVTVEQLNQRLKAVQDLYSTRNQISDTLSEVQRAANRAKGKQPEEEPEISDVETDFQMMAHKMEELDAMKSQLGQIQKIMASISVIQNGLTSSQSGDSVKDLNKNSSEQVNQNSPNSSFAEPEQNDEAKNDLMKLEQAKSKLNHLLEIVQTAQNTNELSPSCLQLVSSLVSDGNHSGTVSPSTVSSTKSPQRNSEEMSVRTMQVMTKELEETTAVMKEERDRLLAARQELQDIAKRLPINKAELETASPEYDSENEPPCLKSTTLNTNVSLHGLTEADQSSVSNDGSSFRTTQARNKQRGFWNSSSPGSNSISQDRRGKNETISRNASQFSRAGSHLLGRDQPQWSPSPSISCCIERQPAMTESQQQLELSGNLCEMMLSESFQRAIRPNDISLQEMFDQHQLLTRIVAQCSQLLWLQQKQIVELRNAFMLQCGSFSTPQSQSNLSSQTHLNIPVMSTPSLIAAHSLSNVRQMPPVSLQQQNFLQSIQQSLKLNSGEMQNIQTGLPEYSEPCMPHGNQFSDGFACDFRSGNFNRFNPPSTNANHSFQQNLSSGFNNRGPNGISSMVPEDSGALNNQVPPGNRANNYWDNFRSYSRQNLLSYTKSNEDSELSRRCSSQDRISRDLIPSSLHNNQSVGGTSQQSFFNHGNTESTPNDQFLLPPSQNTRTSHHGPVVRSCSADPHLPRNTGKNESRHHENDSRNFNASVKNEGATGGRTRNPDTGLDIRSVRNDVGQSLRHTDNINSTRNYAQMVREPDNEEAAHGHNNKKRLDRSRHRNEGLANLNNRAHHNTSLWDSIYAEVSTFIRSNESRPHFLLQLFRDLQQVTTDNLRQRTLVTIQETVTANNLAERSSNMNGGNNNIIENRNNIRESRSNLNRNLTEDPDRIDELFFHLRENQNTIRQNIGMSSYILGGNLENPNISNIRDLGSSRNNLENEGLRDLRTYFEANLCNFGHNSTLENPNLSNIRENLTRRVPGMSDMESVHSKNIYLSIYDNAIEPRRRNQDPSTGPDFGSPYRNFEQGDDFLGNEMSGNCESVRISLNHIGLDNNFEAAVGGRVHFQQESRATPSRFSVLESGDNFSRSRQFIPNGNDSGIDINFNNDERKRGPAEGDSGGGEGSVKAKKNGASEVENAASLPRGDWERNGGRETALNSPPNTSRKEVTSPFIPICDNFFHCRSFQQTDNGDLAEADQSRNEETSGAESDGGFVNAQIVDSGIHFSPDGELQTSNNFSSQNIPEAERNFAEGKNCENDCNTEGSCAAEPEGNLHFANSTAKQEGNSARRNDDGDTSWKNESADGFYFSLNASSSSEGAVPKSGVKYRKRAEESARRDNSGDFKQSSSKTCAAKFRETSFPQGKYNGTDDFENRKTDTDTAGSVPEGRQPTEGRDSLHYGAFQLALDKSLEAEKGSASPEAESDWECGSGLDQVPTKLNKSGSSRKPEESGG